MKKTKGKEEKDCIFWDKHYKNPKQISQASRWVTSQNNYWKTALILNEKCSYRHWVVIPVIEGLWQLATKRAPVVYSSAGDNTQLLLIDLVAPWKHIRALLSNIAQNFNQLGRLLRISQIYDDLIHSAINSEFAIKQLASARVFLLILPFAEFESAHFQLNFQ